MTSVNRLGLGCMGMNMATKDRSVACVRHALERGVTLLNTGEFYGGGESEMVLREALAGVPHESYFLSLKFGVLPRPEGGIYGLDVKPWNVKAHLAYSLHRMGLDYVDLYQPARMDEAVPVEELVGAVAECVEAGYVRHIGLTQLSAEDLVRAATTHPIHTVELDYSLANRAIERNGTLKVARENGIGVLAFGVLAHGLLSDVATGNVASGRPGNSDLSPETKERVISGLREIAREKGTTVERLAQAWAWAKNPEMSILIGTTQAAHLDDSIEALSVELTTEDVARIEAAFPAELIAGTGMRTIIFRDGHMTKEL